MKRLLAMILALLLVVPFPVYAGATPSDADIEFSVDDISSIVPYANNPAHIQVEAWLKPFINMGLPDNTKYVLFDWDSSTRTYRLDRSKIPNNYCVAAVQFIFHNSPVRTLPTYNRWYLCNFYLNPGDNTSWPNRVLGSNVSGVFIPPYSNQIYLTNNLSGSDLIDNTSWGYRRYAFALKYTSDLASLRFVVNLPRDKTNGAVYGTIDVGIPQLSFTLAPSNFSPDQYEHSSILWDRVPPPNDSEIQNDINSAVQQIPNKISDVTDAVQDVVQGITNLPQNIAGALEPHYDNILQQLHHITEQLHALWDQLAAYFNDKLIPQMITDTNRIVEAIENVNHEVNIDLDALKQQLTQQHKEQLDNDNKNTEKIVNGYENGDMDSITGQFGDAATNSDNAEDQLIDSVSGNISDFTFDPDIMFEYIEAIDDVAQIMSYFLELSIIKTPLVFMLTLSIALLMIGYYRFKGGG